MREQSLPSPETTREACGGGQPTVAQEGPGALQPGAGTASTWWGWIQHTEGGRGSRVLKCARGISSVWDFRLFMNGGGGEWGSRILRKQGGREPNRRRGGRLPAPQPPSQPGGRADGAPFGAGWEARKFPPDVPPRRVKWEAGSCREGRGRRGGAGGLGLEGERPGRGQDASPLTGRAQPGRMQVLCAGTKHLEPVNLREKIPL